MGSTASARYSLQLAERVHRRPAGSDPVITPSMAVRGSTPNTARTHPYSHRLISRGAFSRCAVCRWPMGRQHGSITVAIWALVDHLASALCIPVNMRQSCCRRRSSAPCVFTLSTGAKRSPVRRLPRACATYIPCMEINLKYPWNALLRYRVFS